jgi:hypothetical protein
MAALEGAVLRRILGREWLTSARRPPGAGLIKPHRRVAQIGVGCLSYAR